MADTPTAAPVSTPAATPAAPAPVPTSAPTTPPPAPVASSVPAPSAPNVAAPAAPDLSYLGQAGPTSQSVQEQMAPFVQRSQEAAKRATDLANAPAPVPPTVPHARLMNMIQGLAVGLGSFGTSIATHGREGGPQQVQQFYANKQAQQIQAQQAATAKRNAEINQQLTIADTNQKMAQNIFWLSTVPLKMQSSDLEVQQGKNAVEAGQIENTTKRADFTSVYGVSPTVYDAITNPSGTNAAAVTPDAVNKIRSISQQRVNAFASSLPNNAVIKNAQDVVNNPNSSPADLLKANADAEREVNLRKQAAQLQEGQSNAASAATKEKFIGSTAQAELTKDQAQAKLAQSEAANLSPAPSPNGKNGEDYIATLPIADQGDVRAAGSGRMNLQRWDYLISRNKAFANEVTNAYPDFDSSKIAGYAKTVQDYTSGKTAIALNSGATALQHLQQLKAINDANPSTVHIYGTPAYNSYNNLLDTLTGELARFYGMPDTDQTIKNMKATLGATTYRDAAIQQQAKAMSRKFDSYEQQWKNAAPSAQYAPEMPGISPQAKAARAALDPEYVAKVSGASQNTQAPPATATGKAKAANGQWYYHDAAGHNLGPVGQ